MSVTGFDIFAWNDPPTLSRYLAVGPARLIEMRIEGIGHNLFSVLLLIGLPISLIGLIGLPWAIRGAAIRPVVIVSFSAFIVTSLIFPVSTTWGTFLHAAGPFHVLLVLSALLALDALIARLGGSAGLDATGRLARPAARDLRVAAVLGGAPPDVRGRLAQHRGDATKHWPPGWHEIGHPLDASAGPIISNFPIWMAETQRTPALALPDEPPRDVLDLANDPRFGARLVVLIDADSPRWPHDIDAGVGRLGLLP